MRLVVQRVQRAVVRSGGEPLGTIGAGAVVLVGIAATDSEALVERVAEKLIGLRYFEDDAGRTNLSIAEVGGSFLVVSQFTLLAELRRGRRPGFTGAAPPELAEPLIQYLVALLRATGTEVETGRFGAEMEVELVNDGPFTLLIDSDRDLGPGPA